MAQQPPEHVVPILEQPAPVWRDNRRVNSSSEMHSVAGTEQYSIIDKISRRDVKGLHDMVKQQQQQQQFSSSNGFSASVLSIPPQPLVNVPSDVLSDLSDQTSREARHDDLEVSHLARNVSGVAISESKNVLKIVQSIQNLSPSEMAEVYAILSQMHQGDTMSEVEVAPPAAVPAPPLAMGFSGKERSRSLGTPTPSPRLTPANGVVVKSGHVSQSPSTVAGASKQKSVVVSGPEVRRSNSGQIKAPISTLNVSSSLEVPNLSSSPNSHMASKRSHAVDMDDDVDEEMAFLLQPHDSIERGGLSSNTTTPHRGLTTPSPKHKRAITTPTKTPPIRSGAIPAIANYLGRDSLEADTSAHGTTILSATPNKGGGGGGNKYRESQSPPNIWRRPADASVGIALPVGVRKGARKDSSSVSSMSSSVDCSISESTISRKHRMASGMSHGNTTSPSHMRGQSTARLSELHMSPRSAFDDRSVNSMSSSSASYYSHHKK